MKKFLKISFTIIFCLLALAFLGFLFIKKYDKGAEKQRLRANYDVSKEYIDLIKDGDVILRRGYGFVSDMIVKRLNEQVPISHCAIAEISDTSKMVIHSVSQAVADLDGVQSQSLKRFIKDSKENSLIVVRFKYPDNQDSSKITNRARYYLDKKIPFDMKFDIQDSTRFYCTELIWRVLLEEYGVDIFEKKYGKNLLEFHKFDIFLDTAYFEVVWSHQNIDLSD